MEFGNSVLVAFWHWRTACNEDCCLPSKVNWSRLWRENSVCMGWSISLLKKSAKWCKRAGRIWPCCGGNLPGKRKTLSVFHTDLLSVLHTVSIRHQLHCKGFLSSVMHWYLHTRHWRRSSERWCHFLVKTFQKENGSCWGKTYRQTHYLDKN